MTQYELLRGGVELALGAALLAFVVSEVSHNYSQVDRLWSILPGVFAWYFAAGSGWMPRPVLTATLVTLWGARLTFNFWRRGGYGWPPWTGVEDYRWAVLRAKPPLDTRWGWLLFNLLFVSLYQVGLLLLITLPSVAAAKAAGPLSRLDLIASLMFLGFVVVEAIADQQQYDFQTEKAKQRSSGEKLTGDVKRGFRTTGLFGLARHPNFAAEQMIWISYYLFSVAATGRWITWYGAGAVLLVLLFQGSTSFTESISMGKYPEYAEYRRQVPRFIPKILAGVRR